MSHTERRAHLACRTGVVAGITGMTLILIGFVSSRPNPLASQGSSARRFNEFHIIAWWGPAGQPAFETYRDAGFTLHATNLVGLPEASDAKKPYAQ